MECNVFVGSAGAGFISRLIVHPIDTCKTQIQTAKSHQPIGKIFKNVLKHEGVSGLYRGLGAALLGSIPGACIYISSYEVCNFLLYFFIKFSRQLKQN
jgi:hypothetical protein